MRRLDAWIGATFGMLLAGVLPGVFVYHTTGGDLWIALAMFGPLGLVFAFLLAQAS